MAHPIVKIEDFLPGNLIKKRRDTQKYNFDDNFQKRGVREGNGKTQDCINKSKKLKKVRSSRPEAKINNSQRTHRRERILDNNPRPYP